MTVWLLISMPALVLAGVLALLAAVDTAHRRLRR